MPCKDALLCQVERCGQSTNLDRILQVCYLAYHLALTSPYETRGMARGLIEHFWRGRCLFHVLCTIKYLISPLSLYDYPRVLCIQNEHIHI